MKLAWSLCNRWATCCIKFSKRHLIPSTNFESAENFLSLNVVEFEFRLHRIPDSSGGVFVTWVVRLFDAVVCQLKGVTDCTSEIEKSGLLCRQEPIGYDRHRRKYWFMCRRIVVYVLLSLTVDKLSVFMFCFCHNLLAIDRWRLQLVSKNSW